VVDYQRQTCDESIAEARRDPLPLPRWKTLEYAVHGKWKMRTDGSAFPDTFWLSIQELKACGASREQINVARLQYEEEAAAASEEAIDDLPLTPPQSSDDEEESEQERETSGDSGDSEG
jgi:hypothetical protein